MKKGLFWQKPRGNSRQGFCAYPSWNLGRIQASALALKVVTGFPRGQLTGVSALLGDLGPASADSVVQQCLLRAWPAACSTWAEAANLRAKAASVQEDSPAEVTSSSVGEAFPHRLGSFLHLASLSSPTGAVVSVWFYLFAASRGVSDGSSFLRGVCCCTVRVLGITAAFPGAVGPLRGISASI